MDDFTRLATVHRLLDRARSCIAVEDLPGLVMSDPGSGDYVAAYERVLAGGVPALLEVHDGVRLFQSFDITENLLLSHSDASHSVCHRWFSVLTAGIEILAWNGLSGLRDRPLSQSLFHLMTDSFALRAAEDPRAPLDLLPAVFEELGRASPDRHLHAFALLCELLVAGLGEAEVAEKCQALTRFHDEFQEWYAADGSENAWFVERSEFIWGALLNHPAGGFRPRELRGWLELVKAHFPTSPELARTTAERLLREGEELRRASRRR